MAGKAIDNNASGVLILIIPIAFAIVILFKAWPVVLALVLLGGSVSTWQRYQWQQWSQQLDPIFRELIQENRGYLTPLDLSIKANISGTAAKRYLDGKADEFGTQPINYEDKGMVYYFITANTLGNIFDEGVASRKLELQESGISAKTLSSIFDDATPSRENTEPFTAKAEEILPAQTEALSQKDSSLAQTEEELSELPPLTHRDPNERLPQKHRILQSLIQSELARRLDVHSSTVMKRRDDTDFAEWSRSRDPEGIAWEYSPDTREFYPIETV